MTTPSTPWRVAVKFGPDGEENYAWVVADDGTLIGTFKTHHAHTVANAVNAYDKQRALIETLAAALIALSLDVRDYPAWQRPCHALDLADAALAAAKEQSA